MEIIYKAKDGKLFDNACDCEDYEWELNRNERKEDLVWVNKAGIKIPLNHSFDEVFGFICLSAAAVDFMIDLLDNEGLRCDNFDVNEPCWYYEEDDCFIPIYEKISYHQQKIEEEETKAFALEQGGLSK